MSRRLVSFDRFYEQKNMDYIKLMNHVDTHRSKTTTKKRLLNLNKNCST
jgi:hypothetical protein